MITGWKFHMARWHFFRYDPDLNDGGSVCGKYGLQVLGRSRKPRSLQDRLPFNKGESICEECSQNYRRVE